MWKRAERRIAPFLFFLPNDSKFPSRQSKTIKNCSENQNHRIWRSSFFFVSTLLTSTANLAAMTPLHTVVGREEREGERERERERRGIIHTLSLCGTAFSLFLSLYLSTAIQQQVCRYSLSLCLSQQRLSWTPGLFCSPCFRKSVWTIADLILAFLKHRFQIGPSTSSCLRPRCDTGLLSPTDL